MYFDIHNKDTGKYIGRQYACNCCGDRSKRSKSGDLPKDWVEKTETPYDQHGKRRRGKIKGSFVNNYYCGRCNRIGANADIVATVTRKLLEPKKVKTPKKAAPVNKNRVVYLRGKNAEWGKLGVGMTIALSGLGFSLNYESNGETFTLEMHESDADELIAKFPDKTLTKKAK
jgi:hypothetical protein